MAAFGLPFALPFYWPPNPNVLNRTGQETANEDSILGWPNHVRRVLSL